MGRDPPRASGEGYRRRRLRGGCSWTSRPCAAPWSGRFRRCGCRRRGPEPSRAVVKVRLAAGIDTADPVPYTGRNGGGHDPRRRVPTVDVSGDGGPPTGRRTSVLRAPERDPERGRLRCFRREAVRTILRADGAAESGGRPLLSAAPGRLLRGLDSERAIAWRAADSLSLRSFLRRVPPWSPPDHSTVSRTRRLAELEEEDVERRMDPPPWSGCAGHEDEGRSDALGPQGRARRGPGE